MIMNLLVIALVLSLAYVWMIRGMFSAMLHMLCVIIAGAIAFAFWEPLSLMLIGASPERGFFSFLESIAWGVALLVPFLLALLLLRTIVDKAIPGNITNSKPVDYAGGALCGIVTGVICAGITVVGLGNMRLSTDFLGYQPLWYAEKGRAAGSLVETDALWIPVDSLVATIYGRMSTGAMSTEQPLDRWYPELELAGFASRISPGEGAARNAIRPEDFTVKGTYIVGDDRTATPIDELLASEGRVQRYVDISGDAVTAGSLMGVVVEFESGAKERGERGGGQLVVSNGQYRLLVGDGQGDTRTVFPVATISESSEPGQYGRWRYDAPDVFITSTGGKSRITMAFEYVIPAGYEPLAFYAKNIRVPADSMPEPREFAGPAERDRLVRTGSILTGQDTARELETEDMVVLNIEENSSIVDETNRVMDVISTTAAKRGMNISDDNEIVGGQGNFDVKAEVGRSNAPRSRKLRVEDYAVDSDQALIKVDVSADSPIGFLSGAAREAELDAPLLLIDANGNEYEAIGYEYQDREIMTLRYTLGSTLAGIEDTPSLSTTRTDQELNLLFIVTAGVEITHFTIGDTAVARFDPPLDTD